jgi:diguanylate cyclase (GGDEF)-like protein
VGGDGQAEVLFDDDRTRVSRLWLDVSQPDDGPGTVICKEARGADAAYRIRAETAMLRRLAGLAGIPRLAPVTMTGALLLEDDGATPVSGLAPAELADFGRQLASVVAAIHRRGVLHGDISLANIMLTRTDRAVLLVDFDLATTVTADPTDPAAPAAPTAAEQDVLGTLPYLAPERTGHSGLPVDQRTDLYAVGAVLYELASGRPPFGRGSSDRDGSNRGPGGPDDLRLVRDILLRVPTPLTLVGPQVPPVLSDIVARLLEKEPERRYQSAEGLVHDLDRAAREPDVRFPLGAADFPPRLAAPARLIGRDGAVAALGRAFEQALAGGTRGVLVGGCPGVGKSALVNQLRPIVTAHGGWYVTGKSDVDRPAAGTGAILQALRGVGRLLLAEPEPVVAAARDRLHHSLGAAEAQVTTALPEFALLLGIATGATVSHDTVSTAGADESDPALTEARLRQGTVDLLDAVVSADHPLVLVVDDLQWADPITLGLLDAVLTAPGPPGLLVVGTYRDDEIDAALSLLLARWQGLGATGAPIHLENLTRGELATLLAEMLRLPTDRTSELADALAGWTAGNPYDTVEQLNALRRDELLTLHDGGWHWDAAAIRRQVAHGDIETLLRQRVARLPPETAGLLHLADTLGGEVGLELLALAADEPVETVRAALDPALDDGLLSLVDGDRVRFGHDRVRQAVSAGLAATERSSRCLVTARRLNRQPGLEVEAATQYLAAAPVTGPDERHAVARLYRVAAARARQLSDNPTAGRFLTAAVAIVRASGVAADDPDWLALLTEQHAVRYGLGQLEEADAVYDEIAEFCPDPVALSAATATQVSSLSQRQRHHAAVTLALDLLRRLGRPVPDDRAAPIRAGLDRLIAWSSTLDLEADLGRPDFDEPVLLATERLFSRILPSAFFLGEPELSAWIVLESQRLWEQHGPSPALAANLSCAGLVAMAALHDYRIGHTVGRHVLAVAEARGYEPYSSVLRHRYALHAMPWVEPLERSTEQAQRAHAGLVRGGDTQMASHTYLEVLAGRLECGASLEEYGEQVEAAIEFAAATGNEHSGQFALAHREIVRALRGSTPEDERANEPAPDLTANRLAAGLVHIGRSLVAAVFDDGDALVAHSEAAFAQLEAVPGYAIAQAHLMRALGLVELLRRGAGDRAATTEELDAVHGWLAARAIDAPENFTHLARLVEAERARALGDFRAAAAAFDEAIAEVSRRQRPWHRAFITERAARLYLEHGVGRTGLALLAQARHQYAAWGADAKTRALDEAYPQLRGMYGRRSDDVLSGGGPPSRDINAGTIDTLAVLRASQALSSETSLSGLTAAIGDQLTTLTGASDVLIALCNEDTRQWFVPAPSGPEPAIPIAEAGRIGMIPFSAVRYVERTQEPVLVADALQDDRFQRDPYLAGLGQCSLLVVPLRHQGRTRAILILANRDRAGVFTGERLDAVQLIAGQLTVSLGNALLYGSLEDRVAERTEALAAANRQLEILSITDSLTGLPNRRHFGHVLDTEWHRAARHGRAIGVAMVDVDLFKPYNDAAGHLAGDDCLRRIAECLARSAGSPEDLVARYGGEEFAFILPGAGPDATARVGDRARAAVEGLRLPHAANPPGVVTVSIGCASVVPRASDPPDTILARADAALYAAKRAGRNRTEAG